MLRLRLSDRACLRIGLCPTLSLSLSISHSLRLTLSLGLRLGLTLRRCITSYTSSF